MKTICTSIFLLLALASIAQEPVPNDPPCKVQPYDMSVSSGQFWQYTDYSTIEDFRKLAPNSDILKDDLSDHSGGSSSALYIYPVYSVNMGLRFYSKSKQDYKHNPQVRVGFSFFTQTLLTANYSRADYKRYDTLTSSQTGDMIFVDSVHTSMYGMSYSTEELRLDASVIYRTSSSPRWSLYAGLGINAGWALQATTVISHNDLNATTYATSPSYNWYNASNSEFEQFRNKGSFGAAVYFPLGINMRLGKKREFWMPFHIYAEMRAGLNMNSIPGVGSSVLPASQFGIGLRYVFGQQLSK
jgi:hypothetical protein